MTLIAGRYRLDSLLGQGGTGEVWRAYDLRLERPVALKLLHVGVARDEDARLRLRREADALARLRHENIVGLLDLDEQAERPYLVQEFLPGGTLSSLAATGPHPWERVRPIALGIARALAHAHAAGVVHRDMKPSNVLFGSDGHVFVADFGLARLLASEDGTITTTGTRLGSPEYWSPEQAAGQSASEKADLYALGVILFQLLTGQLPFAGDDRLAAGYRRVHEEPPRPRDLVPTMQPEVDDLIRRLMRRDPVARPRAADVVRALELAGGPDLGVERPEDATRAVGAAPTARLDPEPAPRVAPTERLVPPTEIQPPRGSTAGTTQPPPAAPAQAAAPPRLGAGGAVVGTALVVLGGGIAALVDADVEAVRVDRDGIAVAKRLTREDAVAALVVLGGITLATIGLLVLVVWAVRGSGRARSGPSRAALALLAIVLAAVAAGAVVWAAYGLATANPSGLWERATT